MWHTETHPFSVGLSALRVLPNTIPPAADLQRPFVGNPALLPLPFDPHLLPLPALPLTHNQTLLRLPPPGTLPGPGVPQPLCKILWHPILCQPPTPTSPTQPAHPHAVVSPPAVHYPTAASTPSPTWTRMISQSTLWWKEWTTSSWATSTLTSSNLPLTTVPWASSFHRVSSSTVLYCLQRCPHDHVLPLCVTASRIPFITSSLSMYT